MAGAAASCASSQASSGSIAAPTACLASLADPDRDRVVLLGPAGVHPFDELGDEDAHALARCGLRDPEHWEAALGRQGVACSLLMPTISAASVTVT